MSTECKGLTGVREVDWEILNWLPTPTIVDCLRLNKAFKEIITKLFGKLACRDFRRYFDQKIIIKSPDQLSYADYKALYLFRKNLIAANIEHGRYAIGLAVALESPLWPRLFGAEMGLLKAFYNDSIAFYLPPTKNESGKIAVLKLNGKIYEFAIPFVPSAIFVSRFTIFLFQKGKQSPYFHHTLSLYDYRNGAQIGSSFTINQYNDLDSYLYWISDDNLIINIKNVSLESITPSGERKVIYECLKGESILHRKLLNQQSFVLRIVKHWEADRTVKMVVFKQNTVQFVFYQSINEPHCGYFEDETFWNISEQDSPKYPIKNQIYKPNNFQKVFANNKGFFLLNQHETYVEQHKAPNSSVRFDLTSPVKEKIQDLCMLGKYLFLFGNKIYVIHTEKLNSSIYNKIPFTEAQHVIKDYALFAKNHIDNSCHFLDFSLTSKEFLFSLTNPYLLRKYSGLIQSHLMGFPEDILKKLFVEANLPDQELNLSDKIKALLNQPDVFMQAVHSLLQKEEIVEKLNRKDIEAYFPKGSC